MRLGEKAVAEVEERLPVVTPPWWTPPKTRIAPDSDIATREHNELGGRDSAPVRGVPYEPTAPYGVCRAKFESVEVLWRVVCDRGGVVMDC
jgi:hypothetical protein